MLRRIGIMALTALTLTFVVFCLTNLSPNLEKLAKSEGSVRMSDEAVASWIENNGFGGSIFLRYGEWMGVVPGWTRDVDNGQKRGRCIADPSAWQGSPRYCGLLQGSLGRSTIFKQPVTQVISQGLGATGWLMFWVMVLMVPLALVVGVIAGMREGSKLDRSLSTFSIASTATPEYVSGVILIAVFVIAKRVQSPAPQSSSLEKYPPIPSA